MKKRIPVILLVLAAAALVVWSLIFIPVKSCLPGGVWFRFEGGAGRGYLQNQDTRNALETEASYEDKLPYGLSYLSPRNLKETLSGCRVRLIRPPENLKGLNRIGVEGEAYMDCREPGSTGAEAYFAFKLTDSHGAYWELWFLEDGTIAVGRALRGDCLRDHALSAGDRVLAWIWGTEVSGTRFYRDNGGCYQALKAAFGDMEDIENWKVETREEEK